MRLMWMFVIIFFLSGCVVNRVSSIRTDEVVPLTGESGYLLIGVQTRDDLNFVDLEGPKSVRLSDKDLRSGTNYILIELPAGQYTISDLELGSARRIIFEDKENWQIEVQQQRINYVGHLEVRTYGYWIPVAYTELQNRSSQALEFLQRDFPVILAGYPLSYGGPGEDHFLPYIMANGWSKQP